MEEMVMNPFRMPAFMPQQQSIFQQEENYEILIPKREQGRSENQMQETEWSRNEILIPKTEMGRNEYQMQETERSRNEILIPKTEPSRNPNQMPGPEFGRKELLLPAVQVDDDFSFEGYQVVRKEFFSHIFDPQLTIKGNSIIFNTACIRKLENVVYILLLFNPKKKQLVIRGCNEGDRDAVRWCVVKDEKRKSRELTCGMFTAMLRDVMGWKPELQYKTLGTVKQKYGQQFFLFDLNCREIHVPQTKTGELKKRKITYFPEDWRDCFGLPPEEHEQAADFDLTDGFQSVHLDPNNSNVEAM